MTIAATNETTKVIVWSELTEPKEVYVEGINHLIADFLNKNKYIQASAANLEHIHTQINAATLAKTNVLIWFGHKKHDEVPEKIAMLIKKFVTEKGMGFIALHSSHFSKPFKKILNCSGAWASYQEDMGATEMVVLDHKHAITRGISNFIIPEEEIYREPFIVPDPLHTLIKGKWKDGSVTRELMTWQVDKGKVVYIRAGHETYPTYHLKEMQQLITNAVFWAAQAA